MSDVKAVYDARRKAVEELRALYDSAEGRDLSAEETQTEERLGAEIERLEKREQGLIRLAEQEKSVAEARALSLVPEMEKRQDAVTANQIDELRAMARGERGSVDIGFEARDLTVGTNTAGGYLVPTSLYNQIHDLMVATSPILGLATVLRTAGGEALTMPRVTAHSSASLIAEAASIGESDPAFDTVTLNAYKFGFASQISSELEQDNAFDIASFVVTQGGKALGRGTNTEFVTGSGSSRPNGIDNATVGKTTAAVAAVTMDELIDLQHSIIAPQRAGAVWLFNDSTIQAIRKLKDANNNYLWQPGNQVGAPDTLLGKPVYADPNLGSMATGVVFGVFGDFSGFYIRFAGGVRIDRSTDYAFTNDLVTYRFLVRVDSDIIDTTGIRTIKNA